jgi:hypothetical protein
MTKPVYAVGDILVLRTFDGRSINYGFLEVASLTRTGTPRVYILNETKEEEIFFNDTDGRCRLRPVLGSRCIAKPLTMCYYPSRQTFAFDVIYGYGFTSLERYDPNATYESEWFSS